MREIGNYLLEQKIGTGNYGSVWKVRDKRTNQEYAMKIVSKKPMRQNPLLGTLYKAELQVMASINHPNILKLKEHLESDNNYYSVMNFCNRGDMYQYLLKKK